MTAPRRRLPWVLLAMILAATTLALMLRPLRKDQPFHVPDAAEARRASALFDRTLAVAGGGKAAGDLGREAAGLGLAAGKLDAPAGLTLAEPDGACSGRGAYMVRSGAPVLPVLVTAPHRGADRDTGPIARELFAEHDIAAAAWNSAPRRAEPGCRFAGDVAREPRHYLTLFSLAFARRFPEGRVVQLHGFDGSREGADRKFDAIVSDGTREPSVRLRVVAACLQRLFPERRIAVFPSDSEALGGTANAQGKALRAAGFRGFTHLELSAAFRSELAVDPRVRELFAYCLGARE